jgi:lysozyme
MLASYRYKAKVLWKVIHRTMLVAAAMLLTSCSTWSLLTTPGVSEEVGCSSDSKILCIKISKDATQVQEELEALIIRHEGYRQHPYPDAGGLAIGYGRNLRYNGISREEALYLLRNDISRITSELTKRYESFSEQTHARRAVLVSMGYNMGLESLSEFTGMWNAINVRDYKLAASEIILSRYCDQVGKRCIELADMMATGNYI